MITTTRASTSNPSNTPVTPQQLRSAGILAGLSAPLLAAAAVAVAVTTRRALPGPGATSEDVIGVAAGAVLTLALARLAWLSLRSALDLRCEARLLVAGDLECGRSALVRVQVCDSRSVVARSARVTADSTGSRTRTASLFLAVAALITVGAQSAGAAEPAPRPSFSVSAEVMPPASASVTDAAAPSGAVSPAAATPSGAAPASGTTSSHWPDREAPDVDAPDFENPDLDAPDLDSPAFGFPAFESAPSDARTSDSATSDTPQPAVPRPGWTPDPFSTSNELSAIVLGTPRGSGTAAEHRTHVVVRGDTLWSIAASYLAPGAPAEDVAASLPGWLEANPLLRLDPDTIEVGQQLTLPASFVSTTSAFGAHR